MLFLFSVDGKRFLWRKERIERGYGFYSFILLGFMEESNFDIIVVRVMGSYIERIF